MSEKHLFNTLDNNYTRLYNMTGNTEKERAKRL
jgi:hypothetical protein